MRGVSSCGRWRWRGVRMGWMPPVAPIAADGWRMGLVCGSLTPILAPHPRAPPILAPILRSILAPSPILRRCALHAWPSVRPVLVLDVRPVPIPSPLSVPVPNPFACVHISHL